MQLKYGTPYLTTYDLVKTLALVLMLLDHIGYYFYPDNEWYRVAGRGSIPIWAFLVGYAQSRDVSKKLWLWATALLVVNLVCGGPLLPVNVLFTFLFTRLILDRIARMTFSGWEIMVYSFIAMGVLLVPTMLMSEYGTGALLLALCGYAVRHADDLKISRRAQQGFIICVTAFHALSQNMLFDFGMLESKAAAFLSGAVMLMMYFFKPIEFISASGKIPRPVTALLQFMGRYTMEIYVIHLIILKLIAASYGLVEYQFFRFNLVA